MKDADPHGVKMIKKSYKHFKKTAKSSKICKIAYQYNLKIYFYPIFLFV